MADTGAGDGTQNVTSFNANGLFPGYTTVVESSPVPTREQRSKARSRTREHLTDEVTFWPDTHFKSDQIGRRVGLAQPKIVSLYFILLFQFEFMKNYLAMSRNRVSQVAESLIDYTDTFAEYDPALNPAIPSNPWVADDPTYWMLNQPLSVLRKVFHFFTARVGLYFSSAHLFFFNRVDVPTEKRVRKWAISLEDLITDPLGAFHSVGRPHPEGYPIQ